MRNALLSWFVAAALVHHASAALRNLFSASEVYEYNSRCLDGSPAGYFIHKTLNPLYADYWSIYLEGGGWCFANNTHPSIDDCRARAKTAFGSSKYWPLEVDYQLGDFNSVFIPYCTGDFWGGQMSVPDHFGLYYSGHFIVNAVIQKLVKQEKLNSSKVVIFNGGSAGAVGAWVNFDFVQRSLPSTKVMVYSDAGWFPDTFMAPKPLPGQISLNQAMAIVYNRTKPYLNLKCVEANQRSPYICYSAHNVFPFIGSTEVFIGQSFFDAWAASYFGTPANITSPDADEYFSAFSAAMKLSLDAPMKSTNPAIGLFLTTDFVHDVQGSVVNGQPFVNILVNWFSGSSPSREIGTCKTVNCHAG